MIQILQFYANSLNKFIRAYLSNYFNALTKTKGKKSWLLILWVKMGHFSIHFLRPCRYSKFYLILKENFYILTKFTLKVCYSGEESVLKCKLTRKYPLCRYILGVLMYTTAWDRLWEGDKTLKWVLKYVAVLFLA